ncbi:MAG: DNA-3-methyladenine glycosylase I [Thermoguttaceae bacterium]
MKINAAISNAKLFLQLQKEHGSFCEYLRSFLPNGEPITVRISRCFSLLRDLQIIV